MLKTSIELHEARQVDMKLMMYLSFSFSFVVSRSSPLSLLPLFICSCVLRNIHGFAFFSFSFLYFLLTRLLTKAEGSRQSCPSVESLPLAYSFSLRSAGASGGAGSSRSSMALPHSHQTMLPATMVNPYSTPHHPSSPPILGHHHSTQQQQDSSSSSPKPFVGRDEREGAFGIRSGNSSSSNTQHRYSSGTYQHRGQQQQHQQQHHRSRGPAYPPPPVPTSAPPLSSTVSRFSQFQQSIGSSLVQAEAALWGTADPLQRRSSANSDSKSRGEDRAPAWQYGSTLHCSSFVHTIDYLFRPFVLSSQFFSCMVAFIFIHRLALKWRMQKKDRTIVSKEFTLLPLLSFRLLPRAREVPHAQYLVVAFLRKPFFLFPQILLEASSN